jgi:hypothetical protein
MTDYYCPVSIEENFETEELVASKGRDQLLQ